MSTRIDIILFGASGFTGSYCIEALSRLIDSNGVPLTWGVAGRFEHKIKEVLNETGKIIGKDLSSVPIVIADVHYFESIRQMTARCRVIIDCCGPFALYGESVVKACVQTGTSYVDISGEPQFIQTMQLKYHQAAQEKGIYIVSACGFDSVPADFGVLYLQEKFEGTINSVETYLQYIGKGKPTLNYGTYQSAVHGFDALKDLPDLWKKLYPNPLPNFVPTLKSRLPVHKSSVVNKWCVPFLGADRSVIQRTQRHLFEKKKSRPVQIQTYLVANTILVLLGFLIMGGMFALFASFKFGRYLLLQYPLIFTAGIVSHERASKHNRNKGRFEMTFEAEGWKEKLTEITDEFTIPPNKKMVARLSANDPGYTLTSALVCLAAIVVLTEADKLPKGGGVYTPGIAFKDTSYRKLVQDNGLKFEILDE